MNADVDLRGLAIDRSDKGPPNVRIRRHLLTRYVLPLILILGFLLLVGWASRDLIFPPSPVKVVPVFSTTAEVQQEGTPLFKAAGWIEPRPTPIRVAALAPGVVARLLVVEDQAVKTGDTIAELVKDDSRLTHDAALADLELRQAELDEVKAAFVGAETRLKQPVHLQAALAEAEAALAKIQTQLKELPFKVLRAEADSDAMRKVYEGKLAAKGVIAGIEIDIARGKAVSAKTLVDELKDRLRSIEAEKTASSQRRDALKTQLELLADETEARDEALARVKGANARVSQTLVAVAAAKLRLDRMTIIAPVDGRIYRLIAHPGARIGGGMTQMAGHDGSTVVTMYQPKKLQVRVDARFEDIPKVTLNQLVEIDNPALSSPLIGKVLFVSSEADIQKNTLQVKVEIPDPPDVLKPEMLVDVTFLAPEQIAGRQEPTTTVKLYVFKQLIHDGGDGPFVWLADQSEGVARMMPVETGSVGSNGLVEIVNGLSVSSRIISRGIDGLKDGDRIRVTSEDPTIGTGTSSPHRSNSSKLDHLPLGANR